VKVYRLILHPLSAHSSHGRSQKTARPHSARRLARLLGEECVPLEHDQLFFANVVRAIAMALMVVDSLFCSDGEIDARVHAQLLGV